MGIEYNSDDGIIQTAVRIYQTIIPVVVSGWEFWFLLCFNLTVFMTSKMGWFNPLDYNLNLPWELTGVTGGLMTFFVVFYNSHVFGRYNDIYDLTQAMSEDVLQIASMLRVQIPNNKAVQRKGAKLVLASCFMFFFERSVCPEEPGKLISKRELSQLFFLELLDKDEINAVRTHAKRFGIDAVPSMLLLQWVAELVLAVTDDPEDRFDMLQGFWGRLYSLRRCQAQVVQKLDMPMPFQYFHIMNFMLVLNLVLWAYALGCQDSWFAPGICMFVQMMFQGIRELSTSLANPFGQDDVDFPANEWMRRLYSRVHSLIEDNGVELESTQMEMVHECRKMVDPIIARKSIHLKGVNTTAPDSMSDRSGSMRGSERSVYSE